MLICTHNVIHIHRLISINKIILVAKTKFHLHFERFYCGKYGTSC